MRKGKNALGIGMRLLVFVLIQGLCLTGLFAQSAATAVVTDKGRIKGRVVDLDGTGVPNAIVFLWSKSQFSSKHGVADLEGRYRFPLLSASNDYYVRVDEPGYVPMELGPLDVKAGKVVNLEVVLRALADNCQVPPLRLRCGKTSVQTLSQTLSRMSLGTEVIRLVLEPGELVIRTTSNPLSYDGKHEALLTYTGLAGIIETTEQLYNVHLRLIGGRDPGYCLECNYQSDWIIPCHGSAVIASPDSFSSHPDSCTDHFSLKVKVSACDINTGVATFEVSVLP
ncbi:MAG: hypothetical protein A3B31_00145 [Candidatus Komeilibacteria bacterium RIFCSPLOWO2_01_FULL_53_11]|uniref:Carboxypeptidase regulatory-like domain-containing protein n=1 Tax=Candidatus Komeilibacteria bacterium RIFCSPLOWO2_01_FULL_53_11 TaxID=1798552 RepID=A0A1G2BT62_9BACT|nr:MAG: hypothetical protein A3B31_00145 [Candidatus Komeilibacteria bacterium RIFCSPLOWO2_01_FULL_53_11]